MPSARASGGALMRSVHTSRRVLLVALAASAALHLFALSGIPALGWLPVSPPPEPALVATIVAPVTPEPTAAPPAPVRQRATSSAPRKPSTRAPAPPRAAPPAAPAESAALPGDFGGVEGADATGDAVASGAGDGGEARVSVPEAASAPPAGQEPPAAYPVRAARLVFDLYYGTSSTKVGQVTHTWNASDARYEAETVAEAVGFVSLVFGARFVQRSTGVLGPGGLMPVEYRSEVERRDRVEAARFDWSEQTIALSGKGETRTVALPAGTQDALSVVHQLYFMQPLPGAMQLDIATGRDLYRQVYRSLGETTIETPLGTIRALHLQRREANGARMDVWLDLERNLLPARIHSVDKRGLVLEQVVREAHVELVAATPPVR